MQNILKNGPLLIVIAACLWALDGVIRRSLFVLPPIIIVFYEHLFGAILILPFIIKSLLKEKFTRKELGTIAFVAMLSGLLGTLWFTDALSRVNFIPFSVVFLLQKLQPIFAVTTAAIFLKERVTKNYAIWAGIALVAAYFVTFKNGIVNLETGAGTAMAALLAVGAAFAWATSTTFSKIALKNKPTDVVTGLRFLFTTVFAFFAVFLLGKGDALGTPDTSQFLRFLLIALTTGMVSILIYYRGLKFTQVKVSTILELVYPVLAVFIDIFLYKSVLAPSQYIAAAVLLFAVYSLGKLQQEGKV